MLDESTPMFATLTSHAAMDHSGPLERRAVEVAISADTPATISAYAATYRHFCDWLRAVYGGLLPDGFTALELAVYRGWLRSAGEVPATTERRLAALQRLASHLALDPAIQGVGFDGRGVERWSASGAQATDRCPLGRGSRPLRCNVEPFGIAP